MSINYVSDVDIWKIYHLAITIQGFNRKNPKLSVKVVYH